jgi:hypothetical protein
MNYSRVTFLISFYLDFFRLFIYYEPTFQPPVDFEIKKAQSPRGFLLYGLGSAGD